MQMRKNTCKSKKNVFYSIRYFLSAFSFFDVTSLIVNSSHHKVTLNYLYLKAKGNLKTFPESAFKGRKKKDFSLQFSL